MPSTTDMLGAGRAAMEQMQNKITSGDSVIVKAAENLPSLTQLVGGIAFLTAIVLFYIALSKAKQAHESGQQKASYREAVLVLLSAVMLFNLPGSIDTFTSSLLGTPSVSVLAYAANPSSDGTLAQQTLRAILAFVQFVGLLAFIRGWFVMHGIGKSSDASLGKALTHIIGGVLAMNIEYTALVTSESVGVGNLSTFLGV